MKFKLLVILNLLSFLFCAIDAQEIKIRFRAIDVKDEIDSVKVFNLQEKTSIAFNGNQILRLTEENSAISTIFLTGSEEIRFYPNPMYNYCSMEFDLSEPGLILIEIFDLSGRLISETHNQLLSGIQKYRISGIMNGAYFVRISSDKLAFTGKFVSASNNSGKPEITYVNTIPTEYSNVSLKNASDEIEMEYHEGDTLLYTFYANSLITSIIDAPKQSKTLDVSFYSCIDFDNNNYPVVQIGDQVWMAKNLKTTHYNDGETIPNVTSAQQWEFYGSPAYCWRDNDEARFKDPYGALYNWHTVNTAKLCPTGWHVPDEENWTKLELLLGGRSDAGAKLKEEGNLHWDNPNSGAENSYNFSMIGGGYRSGEYGAGFYDLSTEGYLWSSDEYDGNRALWRGFSFERMDMALGNSSKSTGMSVRCIKDEDAVLVATKTPTSVTYSSAASGGTIFNGENCEITARGICWDVNPDPDTSRSKSTDGLTGTANFDITMNGLTPGLTYYVRAYIICDSQLIYGNTIEFKSLPSLVTDYDGNTYKTVVIGTQTWLAENLRTTHFNNGEPIPEITSPTEWTNMTSPGFCWRNNDSVTYKYPYGALYNWFTVQTDNICPAGLHVPTDNDWRALEYFLEDRNTAGGKLKEEGTTHWDDPNTGADNSTGFTMLPGGYRDGNGSGEFYELGKAGYLWANKEKNAYISPWFRVFYYDNSRIDHSLNNQKTGFSVRCVSDNNTPTLPIVKTIRIDDITYNSAKALCELVFDGGAGIKEFGFCWDIKPNPDSTNNHFQIEKFQRTLYSTFNGLNPYTTYYLKAYAVNETGIAYGNEISFTTLDDGSIDLNRGLVAYYPFNGNANDESRNGLDGTVFNASLTTDRFGKTNCAYFFDGIDDHIRSQALDISFEEITIQLWINSAIHLSNSNHHNIITIDWGISQFYYNNGALILELSDVNHGGLSYRFPIEITKLQWVHLAFTAKRNGDVFLYINGTQHYLGNAPNTFDQIDEGLGIATNYFRNYYFNGKIDDIRIYNRSLNSSEIQALYHEGGYPLPVPILNTATISNITLNSAFSGGEIISDNGITITAKGVCWSTSPNPDTSDFKTLDGDGNVSFISQLSGLTPYTDYYVRAYAINSAGIGYGNTITFTTLDDGTIDLNRGLMAYYPFNNNANDESGNALNGIVNNAIPDINRFNSLNSCYNFNNENANIKIPNSALNALIKSTLSIWVYWDGNQPSYILSKQHNGIDSYYIFGIGKYSNSGSPNNGEQGRIYFKVKNSSVLLISNTTIEYGKWNHIVVKISNDLRLYINGNLDKVCTGSDFTLPDDLNATSTNIGVWLQEGTYYGSMNGRLDDLRIYNRPLNESEIQTLYHEGGYPLPVPVLSTLPITSITQNSATSGGNISTDNGLTITAKGICWSTSANLDTTDFITSDGDGNVSFTSQLSGLTPYTDYYVRAYAINSAGTGYGNIIRFTTLDDGTIDLGRGLVAYYPFNGNANDESGNGHDGIVNGASLTTDRYGNGNSSFYFDANNATIQLPNNALNDLSNATISIWVYWKGERPSIIMAKQHDWVDSYYIFGIGMYNIGGGVDNGDTGRVYFRVKNNSSTLISNSRLESNKWNHLVISIDQDLKLYINGILDAEISGSDFVLPDDLNATSTTLGLWLQDIRYSGVMNGNLDDIRFYNRALNNVEIQTLYNEGGYPLPVPVLSTATIASITQNSATSGGNISTDNGHPITVKGVCWSTSPNPDTADIKTIDWDGNVSFTSQLTGLTPNTDYYVRAYAFNSAGVGYGSEVSFRTLPNIEYDSITDIEGNVYKTVKIGNQVWMAENLKTSKYNDNTDIPLVLGDTDWYTLNSPAYCWYDNVNSYKNIYGALYNWYAVETNKICPTGWHVATDNDWKTLEIFLGMSLSEADSTSWRGTNQGTQLKNTIGWNWNNNTNSSGFSAMPGGDRDSGHGKTVQKGISGYWWTSSNHWIRWLEYDQENINRTYHVGYSNGFSVRCIKDE